jgi:hypothetical protein
VNWLSDNYRWIFDGVGGAALIALVAYLFKWLWLSPTESSGHRSKGTLTAKDTSAVYSTAASGSHNIQTVNVPIIHAQSVHFGIPIPDPPIHAPATVSVASRPNIEYAGLLEKLVFVSPHAQDGFCDPQNEDQREKSLQALVFKFENKPLGDRKISRARNVIAKINFQSEDGVRHHSISYGVWLNSACNSTSFGIGDTQELLIMSALDDEPVAFEDRRGVSHNFFEAFSYFHESVIDGLEIVSVTVIDQDTQSVLDRKFKVWRDGVHFCVATL